MKRVEWVVEGERVRGRLHAPAGKHAERNPLVVLMHGLASCGDEFYDFPVPIRDAGYAVLTVDYRGHGASEGERGYMSKERVLADVTAGIAAMGEEYRVDTSRVALVGHSTGAALALFAASRLANVRCVAALAPIARLRDEMNPFEFVGYNVARAIDLPIRLLTKKGLSVPYKVDYKRLYASKEAIARARRTDFLQHTLPVKNYRPLVQELDGLEIARTFEKPALVMVAEYDVVVGRHNSRRVYDTLAGPKKFVEVPKSGHSMCGDARSAFVAKHVIEFLDAQLKGVVAQ